MRSLMLFLSSALSLGIPVVSHAAKSAQKSAAAASTSATPPAASAPARPAAQIWDFAVKPDDSVFAIVTHKSGVAAKLAHNHLVAARQFSASISADPNKLNDGKFSLKTKAGDLEFDRSDLHKRWFPTIQALGWLNEPFSALKDSDRDTIRENALAEDQLDAGKFPDIEARVEKIIDSSSKIGAKNYAKMASVAVTIHGVTVRRDFSANISLQGQELNIEAVADFKFTEFGIKPYKALMGALGNDDQFNMLVSFRAVKK